ncbi:hypothetical protein L6E12_18285 [Actinokineospora sp. PR83]|uniref:2OG-Fe(II) oxygenase family protein n=1 Tax=Actinokineospora sp. PR83 TaxID=2884908 RepID=UPI001F3EDDED|nr:2OG-Fe(II) oxygenase family protein [Actinokineospora sp. PR83]MCG8917732.1 hypothetical protein [Actinokineospora sp. PR83]
MAMHHRNGWDWQRAQVRDGRLQFREPDGLDRALRDGFFFVDQPPDTDLTGGDRFARSFYLPADSGDPYRGFRGWDEQGLGKHQGYFGRDEDQTEQFFLSSAHWKDVYPPEVADQAARMRDFALVVLRSVLARLDLPESQWDTATGGCLSGRGTYTLTFNHFRPQVRARGLNVHKDSGWVTVLRSTEPGLEVLRDGEWHPINPTPGAFIVNFGCAMEILTAQSATPVSAVAHRVGEQNSRGGPDRFSYALFVDSSLDGEVSPGMFRYEPGRGLVLAGRFDEFLDRILGNTYRKDTTGLY